MMDVEVLNRIVDEINNKDNNKICILVHINPDGDAIGSGLSMYIALKQLGKEVDLIIPSYPHIYDFLPQIDKIKKDSNVDSYDICICLDCASKERIFEPRSIFDNSKTTIAIDHHGSNTMYGDINFVLGDEPACTQVLMTIFEKLGIELTKELGECIAAGIITDTSGFKNTNVNAYTFVIASKLMNLGIDVSEVSRNLLETKTKAQFELIKLVTNRIEFFDDGKIVFSYITKKDIENVGAKLGDHEGLVDIGKSISGVKVSIFVREDNDCFTVSFRSKDFVNVREIAEYFGGGGHTAASGCIIDGSLEEVKNKLIMKVKEYING